MPRGDRTGPAGAGPMTGRAAGYCAGYEVPGFMNAAGGRGLRGRGGYGGRGHRNRFYATGLTGWQRGAVGAPALGAGGPVGPEATKQQQLDALKEQAEYFQDTLEGINKRIEELGPRASTKPKK